jgi:hypothetical protein
MIKQNSDLKPVFATMLGNAVRICDAKWGTIHRWEGDALQLMATHNLPPAFAEARLEVDQIDGVPPGPLSPVGLASSNHLSPSKVEKGRAIQLVLI